MHTKQNNTTESVDETHSPPASERLVEVGRVIKPAAADNR